MNKQIVNVSSQGFYDFQLQERSERVSHHFTEHEPGKTSENNDEIILSFENPVSYIISIHLFHCFQTFVQLKSNVFGGTNCICIYLIFKVILQLSIKYIILELKTYTNKIVKCNNYLNTTKL